MKIGYARTSTRHQEAGLAALLRALLEAQGCEEIFSEQVSGAEERAQLTAAIRCLRAGDQLLVTKLDRFARSLEHAIKLERCIAAAQSAGKYKGRQPTARAKSDQVIALKAEGVGPSEIARRLNIGVASVYRIFRG